MLQNKTSSVYLLPHKWVTFGGKKRTNRERGPFSKKKVNKTEKKTKSRPKQWSSKSTTGLRQRWLSEGAKKKRGEKGSRKEVTRGGSQLRRTATPTAGRGGKMTGTARGDGRGRHPGQSITLRRTEQECQKRETTKGERKSRSRGGATYGLRRKRRVMSAREP